MGRLTQFLNSILRGLFAPTDIAWRGATRALWILWLVTIVVLFATDVATKFSESRAIGFGAFVATYTIGGSLVALAIYLVSLIRPSYRLSVLAGFFPLLFTGAILFGFPGGIFFAVALIFMISFVFGPLSVLRQSHRSVLARILTFIYFAVGMAILLGFGYLLLKPTESPNPFLETYVLEDWTLDANDPGKSGDNKVLTFAYGNGDDPHRTEFGAQADWTSKTVDGSKLIDHWDELIGWIRTKYWGFDATQLPVQGRVWMPEGSGPFPLVLVVHGNHSMEDYSDPGYDYLGKHLASRGYIFVSVDQNFLNGSTANMIDPRYWGLGEENDARGWMLLEHLVQWRAWNSQSGHPMFEKVDLNRLALMGHSRGGEAVAVAAAFNGLDYYPDDASIAFDYNFNIGAYIAIAPADGQYRPREDRTRLSDINYFVIHGAMDGDVSSFMGSSQYSRIEFTKPSDHIKASLYIAGANHGQFNTSWGLHDTGLPYGWLLNTKDIMPVADQETVARVYFTAFLEATLNNQRAFLPLFADARYGASWLPQTFYINNMHKASTGYLATFDDDLNPGSGNIDGVRIIGLNLSRWRESLVNLKWAPLDTVVAVLAWDEEVSEEIAEYELRWAQGSVATTSATNLVFSASAVAEGTKPEGWQAPEEEATEDSEESEADEASEPDDQAPMPLDWTMVLTDAIGHESRLALSTDQPLYPQLQSHTSRIPLLSTNASSEIVMRRFTLPLSAFQSANQKLDLNSLVSVKFVFDKDRTGVIALDDIGFE